MASIPQMSAASGTYRSISPEVMVGSSPFPQSMEAIVPPVASISIRFIFQVLIFESSVDDILQVLSQNTL
jgi:hypothetical protein